MSSQRPGVETWPMNELPTFREYEPGRDEEALIALLTSESWPQRVKTTFTRDDVLELISSGDYGSGNDLTFFVEVDGRDVGLVRLEDVADEKVDPALDIRFANNRADAASASPRFVSSPANSSVGTRNDGGSRARRGATTSLCDTRSCAPGGQRKRCTGRHGSPTPTAFDSTASGMPYYEAIGRNRQRHRPTSPIRNDDPVTQNERQPNDAETWTCLRPSRPRRGAPLHTG